MSNLKLDHEVIKLGASVVAIIDAIREFDEICQDREADLDAVWELLFQIRSELEPYLSQAARDLLNLYADQRKRRTAEITG